MWQTDVIAAAVTFLTLSGPAFMYHRRAWRNSFHLVGFALLFERLVSRRPIAWTQTSEVLFRYPVWKDVQNGIIIWVCGNFNYKMESQSQINTAHTLNKTEFWFLYPRTRKLKAISSRSELGSVNEPNLTQTDERRRHKAVCGWWWMWQRQPSPWWTHAAKNGIINRRNASVIAQSNIICNQHNLTSTTIIHYYIRTLKLI